MRAAGSGPLVCHAPAVAARLGIDDLPARDVLELYAFVRPATFCLPTPRGLCEALDLPVPQTPEEEVTSLAEAARVLLDELDDMAALAKAAAASIDDVAAQAGKAGTKAAGVVIDDAPSRRAMWRAWRPAGNCR